MYKSLSQRYASPSMEFAEVLKDSESAALLAQYGVTKAPTLLAITADRQTLTYNGGWVGGVVGVDVGAAVQGGLGGLLAALGALVIATLNGRLLGASPDSPPLFACPPRAA
jgi:hypothetical protein